MLLTILTALTVVVVTACDNNNNITETFIVTINANYEGGANITREITRDQSEMPVTLPSDIIIDRGDDFHLIAFTFSFEHASQTITNRVQRGGEISTDRFNNNQITIYAEWLDLRLYNAFNATIGQDAFAIVGYASDIVFDAMVVADGTIKNAFHTAGGTAVAWFDNGVLYDRRQSNLGELLESRIIDFNIETHRGFNYQNLKSYALGMLSSAFYDLQAWISSNNANLLLNLKQSINLVNENTFVVGGREFVVENGLITQSIARQAGQLSWALYFDESYFDDFIYEYLPARTGDFINSFIFTAESANDSNIDEVRMRGSFDWMPVGNHTLAQLTARLDIIVGGSVVSNPTLRFFRDAAGLDEVTGDFMLNQHTNLFVRLGV